MVPRPERRRTRGRRDQDCGCCAGCCCSFSRLRRMKPITCGGKPSFICHPPKKSPALGGKRGRFAEARASLRGSECARCQKVSRYERTNVAGLGGSSECNEASKAPWQ